MSATFETEKETSPLASTETEKVALKTPSVPEVTCKLGMLLGNWPPKFERVALR